MADKKITVLLVDDHKLVRMGFRRIIEDEPELEVVGEASDAEEAVRLALQLKPRVVVMDCALPGGSGIAATKKILEALPGMAVLMLSMHSEDTLVRQALAAGARGYILKSAIDLELPAAIRRVAAGEHVALIMVDGLGAELLARYEHHPFVRRLALTALRALEEKQGRYALATLCIGVGQGAALAMERA